MGIEKTLSEMAERAILDAVSTVKKEFRLKQRPLHIWKDGKVFELKNKPVEFIISKYHSKRYFVVVVYEDGSMIPQFPFSTEKEAKRWVEKQKKRFKQ